MDIGGSRSATAIIECVGDCDGGVRVATVEIWQGVSAVLDAVAYIEGLVAAGPPDPRGRVRPDAVSSEALRLERDHGLTLTEWPQSTARMTICSERLHAPIVEGRLQHPGDPEMNRHVANAVALPTPRGWRLTT